MGSMKSRSSSIIVLFTLLCTPLLSKQFSLDYIFQFGDSISDTGNFYWDHACPCDRYPYGISLLDSHTLPRCSDGLLIIDYFAKFLNLSLNPYLEKGSDFSQGVNFAVAGATALEPSTLRKKQILSPFANNSFFDQLKWFKSHLKCFCHRPLDCKKKLEKSIVFVEMGGNDYNYALLAMKPMEQLYKLVPDVILAIKHGAKELMNEGVGTMILAGDFPIGCVPMCKTLRKSNDPTKYDDQNCLKELNDFAKFHNHQLQVAIQELRQHYPQVTIIYADYFSAANSIITNATSLGFDKDEIEKACCGDESTEYNFNLSIVCGSKGASICDDPSKRVFWDGLHFTQHAYQHMAHWLLAEFANNITLNNNIQII